MSVEPTIGEIMLFAGSFEPTPWFFCDGRLLPISSYVALYTVIGATYGGNGSTTFALPDLRGRFPMGHGQGQGTFRHMGERPGVQTVFLTAGQLPAHSHEMTARGSGQALSGSPAGKLFGRGHADRFAPASAGSLVDMGATLAPAGAGAPHENRQPGLVFNFLIAHSGIYPSRG